MNRRLTAPLLVTFLVIGFGVADAHSAFPKACALFTLQDAQQLLGPSVVRGIGGGTAQASGCTYGTSTDGHVGRSSTLVMTIDVEAGRDAYAQSLRARSDDDMVKSTVPIRGTHALFFLTDGGKEGLLRTYRRAHTLTVLVHGTPDPRSTVTAAMTIIVSRL